MPAGGLEPSEAFEARTFLDSPSLPTWLIETVEEIKAKKGCERPLASGPSTGPGDDDPKWTYCGDYLQDAGLVYIAGPNGSLPRLHTDCDGDRGGAKGVCDQTVGSDDDDDGGGGRWRNGTAFQSLVQDLGYGLVDLNPYVHPYVVLGHTGGDSTAADYDPKVDFIQPLSLVAVFCGNATVRYGIWGDYGRPSRPWVGQASPAMQGLCRRAGGDGGVDGRGGVLMVAFNGGQAAPGPRGADWAAATPDAFADSMHVLGDALLKRLYRRARFTSAGARGGSGEFGSDCVEGGGVRWEMSPPRGAKDAD